MVKQILIVKEIFFEHVNYITSKPLKSVHTLKKGFILQNCMVKIGPILDSNLDFGAKIQIMNLVGFYQKLDFCPSV